MSPCRIAALCSDDPISIVRQPTVCNARTIASDHSANLLRSKQSVTPRRQSAVCIAPMAPITCALSLAPVIDGCHFWGFATATDAWRFSNRCGNDIASWSRGVRVSLHKTFAARVRGSRPCKRRKSGAPRLCRSRSRDQKHGLPASRSSSFHHGGTESQRKNERMKGAARASPTQAKTRLEWATRLLL